ncbi:glycosyl hydrolase [Halalkalibacter hemicellulosilyticus]|uniref:Mannan endo-1,4-beta-mannosidase n=1 Tax=Halalkalibacter hemicellulosilyticusJCM 9152 TaxID=1236971 RepID=W4QCF3_9BACI|nr:glycosyl hydrolase [Halalkalibacter hemicellulosilyticus]GAE29710.1 mannan endo-1,4-beta-mannosidase precursor [Halalkalibacter hemicellulosilyticusJCM 9152]
MDILRKCVLVLLALLLLLPTTSTAFSESASTNERVLNLSDPNATRYTKELFAFLQDVSGEQVLFGQQHATDEGLTLTGEGNRIGSTESEVKNAVGDYPAVLGGIRTAWMVVKSQVQMWKVKSNEF